MYYKVITSEEIMGFLKRHIDIEIFLDESDAQWSFLKDSDFKILYENINNLIDSREYIQSNKDVLIKLENKLPLNGFILSVPERNHTLSIYKCGVDVIPFGYSIKNLRVLNLKKLESIP